MKAITYAEYGDPSVLSLTEVPDPKVGPGEVLIRVRSASVNPVDWKIVAGYLDPLMNVDLPAIPGWDVSGVVEQVGLDTPEFEVGDEVMAYARKDWVKGGSYAELVAAPVRTVAKKPAALDWHQAAGLPLAGLTAYQLLTRLGTKSGDTVLVHAAAGGVGILAVQIAKALGARVIGTASERNHDVLRDLGVEPVTYGEGLADRVRELAPDGVDVVTDFVGGVLDVTTAVLAEGGRHGSVVEGEVQQSGGLYMWVRPDADDLAALGALVDEGKLTVPVASVFPLERTADAFTESATGHVRGKVVISVSE
ncbi:NADP-dependent oxidoreductase [Terracoccus luteus]|jgi:NADPH:quinone reductase-like Zn-dependent oxidoreductase|uniref:NADPH:quinone reductase-like Zn-dependent oxidoreductase n=1 Tax=Terracoccus luteus TaxID=53356 RepID=A0A839Q3V2_9MICO|nr:NADP-dependent oxidoreductase [Terracoccus luteus]MBB2987311.1 NADPH:quinone reductase-like Zn-dependent oxidoreductase [Terracoccus luteus]MCP2172962.1 NADPH:quinone reductase-like Zn-dependent oxidoreductase [Terracoccus luteus]